MQAIQLTKMHEHCIPTRMKSAQKERFWMTSALLSLVLSTSMITLSSGECAYLKKLFYVSIQELSKFTIYKHSTPDIYSCKKNLLSFFRVPYLHIFPANQFTCAVVSFDNTPPLCFEYRCHQVQCGPKWLTDCAEEGRPSPIWWLILVLTVDPKVRSISKTRTLNAKPHRCSRRPPVVI